jgi:hypothetical protein
LASKFSRVDVCDAKIFPSLLYGSEIWAQKKKVFKKRLKSFEMKFSEEQPGAPFSNTKAMEKFWES